MARGCGFCESQRNVQNKDASDLVSVKLYVDKPPSHAPGISGVPVAFSLPSGTWTILAHLDFIFCVFVLPIFLKFRITIHECQ